MMAQDVTTYLDLYLEPLRRQLARPEVTDIYVNQPRELWVECIGGQVERLSAPALDEEHLWRLVRQIASQSHQGISRRYPLLAATLPDGSRVQVVAPSATKGHMALAVRRQAATNVKLTAYSSVSVQVGRPTAASYARPQKILGREDYTAFLAEAVRSRLNIVIAGGTSTGKTTLLNALLKEIPADERLITIEDTPELEMVHENSVGLVAARGRQGEAEIDTIDLLQACLRMRPDRIIMGELRGPEAFTFLRAINTGHPGSLTTVHADTASRALVQLAMMSIQTGISIAFPDAHQLVSQMVDVVVLLERQGSNRVITDVWIRPDIQVA